MPLIENLVDAPEKSVALTDKMAEKHAAKVEQILAAQKKCLGCDGTNCTQEIDRMVPLVKGFRGHFGLSLMECPEKEARLQKLREEKQFADAHLPKIFAERSFTEFTRSAENETAFRLAVQLVKRPKEQAGLYLHGPSGTGKTFLMSLIGRGLLMQHIPVRFAGSGEFLEDLRQHLHGNMQERFALYAEIPALLLDDLGAEQPTPWGLEQLFRLLDTRYKENRRTLFTSNWSLPALEQRWARAADTVTARRIISRVERLCRVVEIVRDVPQDMYA